MISSLDLSTLLHTQNLWLQSAFILMIALGIILVLTLIISWLPLAWAKRRDRRALSFALDAVRYPISVSILLIACATIMRLFHLPDSMQNSAHRIFTSIDVIVWGQFFYRSSQFYLKTLSQQRREGSIIKPQTLPLLENVTAVLIILLMVYLLFIAWNIDMSAWLASAGIIGIAVGFAAKDTIANLLSGVFILADSPYKIGDYIVLDSLERGKVTQIGLRSTRILTRDDVEINIPNAVIANGKITNESAGRHVKSRLRVPVSVAYGSDIDHVRTVLLEVAAQEEQICQDPEPRVRFRQFGASGLDIELLVWIDDPEIRGRVKDSLNTRIYKRFAAENIEIPYSKHDLYIKSLPEYADSRSIHNKEQ
ncbi:MAG: mechanosensitive ion channel family protein [Thiotrichales bacterium]|nr:mechanosensitive ion channel family protein [Thiotrichales bacterium]